MKLFIKIICSFIISTTLLNAKEHISLQLLWKHQFEFAGFYMAKEKGFYNDFNLDVQFKEFQSGINITNDVQTGKSTFGITYPSIILDRSNGANVVLLNSILQSSPHVLVSLDSANINSIKDFKNKTIMMNKDAIKTASILSMLISKGIKTTDIKLIQPTFNINDIITRKADIFSMYISNEIYKLDKANIKYTIWNPSNYGFDFYNDILFTSSKLLHNNPKLVKDFQQASLKGWEYAFSHIDETVDLIFNKYNTQNKTKEGLLYEAKTLKQLAYKNVTSIGKIDPPKIQRIYDIYNLMGLVKNKINLNDFIYHSNSKNKYLTYSEKTYLKNKKTIKMCNNPNWDPIEFANNGDMNDMQGIAIDTLHEIEKKLNIKFINVPTKDWKQSQQFLKEKKCDILPCAAKTSKRSKYANFTQPYLKLPLAIFTTRDKPIVSSLSDIIEKPWSRKKGSGVISKIKKEYPNTKIIETKDNMEALQLVNNGKVYFSIATLPVASHVIDEYMLNNLQISGYTDIVFKLSMAVRDDNKILLSILDKTLEQIPRETSNKIFKKWVHSAVKETVYDKQLIVKILVFIFIISIFFIYRHNNIKKTNKSLKILVDKKTEELKEINENLEQKIIIEIDKNLKREKQLFEASKMAQMGEMIGNIAHQWRQPLSTISTAASGMKLEKEFDMLTDKKFNDACDTIVKNTLHLSKTIDTFRNFIKEKKEQKTILLQDRIDIALDIIEASVKDCHIELIKNIDYTNPIQHTMTVGELSQVIINIINNAKDILLTNKIEEPYIKISLEQQNSYAIITIEDNAGGVPENIIDNIFEPYFTTKHKTQGTGLGLHMSYQIVTEHLNGKLYVKNINNGAKFYIEFPLIS